MSADTYRAHLRQRLTESRVPVDLHDGLVEYIVDRRPTGSFLRAVLENDLAEACKRADWVNREWLYEITAFLWNYCPADAWGSPAQVDAWLAAAVPPSEVYE